MVTLYFFDFELRASVVARRADEFGQWIVDVRRQPCCADSADTESERASNQDVNNRYSDINTFEHRPTAMSPSRRENKTMSTDLVENSGCEWVNLTVEGPPYFLTVVFIVRIYEKDLSELTSQDIKNWLLYLRYAGVDHAYLYDLWYLPGESQREPLNVFIREGYLTYFDKHDLTPFSLEKSQHPSYQHCIDKFGKDTTWQVAIDIDEYPFCPGDTKSGFLRRYIEKFSSVNPQLSEITMNNFLYLGVKNKSRDLLIDKLWRRTHNPGNYLVKPIYKPSDTRRAQVHHNVLKRGQTGNAPSGELRMNHYWGARLQNWGPDTEEILAKTEEDLGMKPIVASFENCRGHTRRNTHVED